MSGGKGGGSDNIGAAQAATDKSLALQKEIYDKNTQLAQPWYQGGQSGLNKLLDLMGLQGGSVKTADQITQQLSPQYTVQQPSGYSPSGMYVDDKGTQYNRSDLFNLMQNQVGERRNIPGTMADFDKYMTDMFADPYRKASETSDYYAAPGVGNIKRLEQAPPIDQQGLNSAVQSAMASQTTPEGYGSLMKAFGTDTFQTDPGYAFRMAEGNKGIERAMAAAGKTLNPEAAKALLRFNQGTAADEYTNAYNRYNNDQTNLFNRLAAISGFGQTAGGQISNAGTNYANASGDALTNMANVQLANQKSNSLFGNLLGAAGTAAQVYTAFSDIRLKHDIKKVCAVDGVNMYHFRYLPEFDPEQTVYCGAMAQDVIKTHPEAVQEVGGYYTVDYSKLPFKMEALWH